ncbi:MAG TPA: hypothetical protein VEK84_17815 [Terriglobales bacterium]|nr:hypothetical protein [Terriglobales bacterium]
MKKRTGFSALTLSCVLGLASMASAAVLNSNQTSVTLTATAPESLTVALTGNAVNFGNVTPGAINSSADTVQVLTTWKLKNGRNAVNVFAYFADATKAMVNATDSAANPNIPSSAVEISGGSLGWTAINTSDANTAGFGGAGAGLTLATTAIDATNKNSSSNVTYSFRLDLSGGLLPQLPADNYTGTLYIQAQATP